MADYGYDIANFNDIEPMFGTMADFDELIKKSKEIGIKVVLDFVPNHTSDEHEWFIKSTQNDTEYADYYMWHPGKVTENGTRLPPTNWLSVFRGSAWTWNENRQAYYLHQFHYKQPDLNYDNPKVRKAMKDVLRFWVRKGAAGFRVDAVPHVFEIERGSDGNWPDEPRNYLVNDTANYDSLLHIYTKNQPKTLELVYEFREVMNELDEELGGGQHVLVTEAYENISTLMKYYGNETMDGAHLPFNFEFLRHININSDAYVYAQLIHNWLDNMPARYTANWVLGNHDQSRIGTRLSTDRIDLINIMLKTLPGASITYQGEEIGMTDVWISWENTVDPQGCQSNPNEYEYLSRDPSRTPFQWSDGYQAGFTGGNATWLPINTNYNRINVKRERGVAYSHLNVFKQLQILRREKTMRYGAAEVKALSKNIFGIMRFLSGERTFIALLNVGDEYEEINAKSAFSKLTAQLEYILITARSIRRKGDKVSSNHIALYPKEAVVLATISS
ncbi:maltase A3-like isoform X2 [Eurosta solidaginis]